MDASLYKDAKVSRGLTYHYFYSPATAGQPTLLLLHGFPSSSFGWHRQVEYFRPKGYGLLVPDILGAGETSKPEDPDAFRLALLAKDIVDLLDAEGLDKVVAIGHDWGSIIVSRLANLYDDRFYAYAWNAVGYAPPHPEPMDIDAFMEFLQTHTGNPRYGYWKYFEVDGSHVLCEENLDSFLQLSYPETPELWNEWITPAGKTKQWLEEKRASAIPTWLTQDEYNTAKETLAKSGLKSFTNFYKAAVRSLNYTYDAKIPQEAWLIHKPALYVAATRDAACPPALWKSTLAKYAPHAKVVELETGHWVQLEATDRLNAEWEAWIEGLNLGSAAA